MRNDYRAWLVAQEYTDRTISTQMSQAGRIEDEYGPIEAIVESGGYDALFSQLTYTAEDERRSRPNPSKFHIQGNLRSNLASYKSSLALYRRFLNSAVSDTAVERTTDPVANVMASESAEKQRLSLERDMQRAVRQNVSGLEPGLIIVDDGAERAVLSGEIDIVARDPEGKLVVIELKAGKADARVIGQTLGYMGDLAEEEVATVRGIIVAHEFDQRTRSAARAVSNLKLVSYAVSFTFSDVV